MSRIKQLSPQEAQKIAAGQVVERPANVVKELIENAIDAGAQQITVYINDSGKSLIRVVDDGCGMNQEDAHTCFAHHATSKITGINDLNTLTTFGFRGEALASISAVSKIILVTKEANALQGITLMREQGVVQSQEIVSCKTGTDISVIDLFYNVPARKKFLKTNDTEWRQILLLFQAFCLSYRTIHFKLYSQNNVLFNCPPATDACQRVAQLWDHTVAAQMIPIATDTISGIISNHTYTRYDRSSLFFFVNNRWVKNYTLSKALLKGYLNVLPIDKFPFACIFITVDPATVDINIHPRKEEVQFAQPRVIETNLTGIAKSALEQHLSAQLQKPVTFQIGSQTLARPSALFTPGKLVPKLNTQYAQFEPSNEQPPYKSSPPVAPSIMPAAIQEVKPARNELIFENTQSLQSPQTNYQIIGQFHKTYILIEQDDSLFLVDQHAAHERILYELFSKRFEQVATIQLMFPQIVTLTAAEIQLLEFHLDIFALNSIGVELLGANQLVVQAIPVHLKEVPLEELVRQTIGWIIEHQKLDKDLFYKKVNEKLHAQMACKAAVKAGDTLTLAQMHQLLTDLEKIENRFTCPHGRPTGWNLPLYEIEKKFKRKL